MADDLQARRPAGSAVVRRTRARLGVELGRLRRERGWTRTTLRRRLAAATGHDLSEQTLATYELGTRSLSVERLTAICFTLDVRPSALWAVVDCEVLNAVDALEAAALPVDLRKLARSTQAELAGPRAWARTQVTAGRVTAVLTKPAIENLAAVCGLDAPSLAVALRDPGTAPTVETTED